MAAELGRAVKQGARRDGTVEGGDGAGGGNESTLDHEPLPVGVGHSRVADDELTGWPYRRDHAGGPGMLGRWPAAPCGGCPPAPPSRCRRATRVRGSQGWGCRVRGRPGRRWRRKRGRGKRLCPSPKKARRRGPWRRGRWRRGLRCLRPSIGRTARRGRGEGGRHARVLPDDTAVRVHPVVELRETPGQKEGRDIRVQFRHVHPLKLRRAL